MVKIDSNGTRYIDLADAHKVLPFLALLVKAGSFAVLVSLLAIGLILG